MGPKTLIELLHIVAGLLAALVIGSLSAWSYPRATQDVWTVTYACMAVSALMGIGPVRRALAADRMAAEGGAHG